MIKLYIDTEFTDLIPGNKLISIALVDENEHFFYAELTDTYSLSDCSQFVKSNIFPLLIGGKYRMSKYDCSLALGNWIDDRNDLCILACDNPSWDMPHIRDLLSDFWPPNLVKDMIFPVNVPAWLEEDIVIENNYSIHNALDDALIMKKAMERLIIDKY